MKISEYIEALNTIKSEHGDLDVETSSLSMDRMEARPPVMDHRVILFGREYESRFFSFFLYEKDAEIRRGEKVCRI